MGLALLTLLAFLGGFGIGVAVCVLADRQDNYFNSEIYYAGIDKQLAHAKAKKTKQTKNG